VFQEGDPPPFGAHLTLRRGVVHARLDAAALGTLHVFSAHFKSGRPVALRSAVGAPVVPVKARDQAEGHVRALVSRAAEALFVRGLVDEAITADPGAHVVVAGDLNDVASSLAVRLIALQDCSEHVPLEKRYSILLDEGKAHIDHVLVTPDLKSRVQSARILNEELRRHAPIAGAEGSNESTAPKTIDSDHAPFVVSFG
jgi:endonuclease/exonuclease/phosphatase family metal-dependent hydrolase